MADIAAANGGHRSNEWRTQEQRHKTAFQSVCRVDDVFSELVKRGNFIQK